MINLFLCWFFSNKPCVQLHFHQTKKTWHMGNADTALGLLFFSWLSSLLELPKSPLVRGITVSRSGHWTRMTMSFINSPAVAFQVDFELWAALPTCILGIAVVVRISKSAPALNLQVNTTGNSCNFLFTWPLKRTCLNWKSFNRNKPNPRHGRPPPFYFIFFPNEATSLVSLDKWFSQGHLTRTGCSHDQIKTVY